MEPEKTILDPKKFQFVSKLLEAVKKDIKCQIPIEQKFHSNQVKFEDLKNQTVKVSGYYFANPQSKLKMATSCESQEFIFYAFLHEMFNRSYKILLYQIKKQNGQHTHRELFQTKTQVTSMRFAFLKSHTEEYIYKALLILGTVNGKLKIINIGPERAKLKTICLQASKIVNLQISKDAERGYCLAFSDNLRIYAVNLDNGIVFAHFEANLIRLQKPFSLVTNSVFRDHFLQSTESGTIVIWKLNSQFASAYDASTKPDYKVKMKYFTMFPQTVICAAATDGLKFVDYIGTCIFLMTKTGVFKIIVPSFQERDQYVEILSCKIPNGTNINCARIDPSCTFLLYSKKGNHLLQKIHIKSGEDQVQIPKTSGFELKYPEGRGSLTNMIVDGFMVTENNKFLMAFNETRFYLVLYQLSFAYEGKNEDVSKEDVPDNTDY